MGGADEAGQERRAVIIAGSKARPEEARAQPYQHKLCVGEPGSVMTRVFVFKDTDSIHARQELLLFMVNVTKSLPKERCVAGLLNPLSSLCYERVLSLIPAEEDVIVQPMLLFQDHDYDEMMAKVHVYAKGRKGTVSVTDSVAALGKALVQNNLYEVPNATWSSEDQISIADVSGPSGEDTVSSEARTLS